MSEESAFVRDCLHWDGFGLNKYVLYATMVATLIAKLVFRVVVCARSTTQKVQQINFPSDKQRGWRWGEEKRAPENTKSVNKCEGLAVV